MPDINGTVPPTNQLKIDWLPSKEGGLYVRTPHGTVSVFRDKFNPGRFKTSHHAPGAGVKYLPSSFGSIEAAREALEAYISELERGAQ